MKTLLQFILKFLARATLIKYKPRIVGITGSVGKTGTKEAVAAVLSQKFSVWQNAKNLNNEIGLPLTILGEHDSGYNNVFKWTGIFIRALGQLVIKKRAYPEFLVLEYGVDKPGDMSYLLSIAKPEVGVVTAISATHLEFMGSIEKVAREKGKLVTSLSAKGVAVLNLDDALVSALQKQIKARVITFGFSPEAEIRADNIALSRDDDGQVKGVSFKFISGGSSVPMLLSGVVGKPSVFMSLAAAAVGVAFNISPIQITQALQKAPLPPGRLRLFSGIKNTILIDDTYNSSPRALGEALEALAQMLPANNARRWAILGDMLELGKDSENLHQEQGEHLVKLGIDYLVTIGERSREIARGALKAGFNSDHVWHFAKSEEVGLFVQDRLQSGDVVLIKGSQGVRCEKITKEIMAEPQRAKELLVRQYKPWI